MECSDENEEWTIKVVRDPRPNEPAFEATLVFCVNTEDGVVTGEVSEGTKGVFLSTVRGIRQQLDNTEEKFMELDFTWGETEVLLSGVTFRATTNNFSGRFRALALNGASSNGNARTLDDPPQTPGSGDTGTGTGTQT